MNRITFLLLLAMTLLSWAPVVGHEAPRDNEAMREQYEFAIRARYGELVKAAEDAFDSKDYETTLEAVLGMLAIERELLGPGAEEVVSTLYLVASIHEDAGQWSAAMDRYREVYATRKVYFGESYWRTIDARLALELCRTVSEMTDAQQSRMKQAAFKRAEALRQYRANEYETAMELAHEITECHRDLLGAQHPTFASSLNIEAGIIKAKGDYASAEPLYVQSRAIQKDVLGEEHPDYATSLDNLAGLYQAMGDYAKAEPLFRQALVIYKRVLGEEHLNYATSLNNLALLHHAMGNYAQAEPLYRQALAIHKRVLGADHPDYATSLNNLAGLHQEIGDYAQAEPLYRQALAIRKRALGEEHPDYATSLDHLAFLHLKMGDYAQAEPLYRQALAIRKRVLDEEHPDYAMSLMNLAVLQRSTGDYAQAEQLHRQALAIRKRVLGEEHPEYGLSLNNLAYLHIMMGDYAHAEPLYRQALAIRKRVLGEEHPDYAQSLGNLAGFYLATGDPGRATPLFTHALEIVRRNLESVAAIQTEQQQLAQSQLQIGYLNGYLSASNQLDDKSRDAYEVVMQWQGATLARQRAVRLAAHEPELQPIFRELQTVTRQWAAVTQRGAVGFNGDIDAWQAAVDPLTEQKEALERKLSAASVAYRQLTKLVTIDEVAAALPTDAVLVDYFFYDHPTFRVEETDDGSRQRIEFQPTLVAFVIYRVLDGEAPRVEQFNLGPAEPIEAAIDTWRESYGQSVAGKQASKRLRERLWVPLANEIGDAELVLISPDGALGRLPFAALPGREPGTYLIEDHRLVIKPVPRLIPAMLARETPDDLPHDMLVFGGIDYDKRSLDTDPQLELAESPFVPLAMAPAPGIQRGGDGSAWSFLAGSDREARDIVGLYRDTIDTPNETPTQARVVERFGAAATEEAFRTLAPTASVLHIATHGFFSPPSEKSALDLRGDGADRLVKLGIDDQRITPLLGSPPGLLSGLVFAGANNPPTEENVDDGLLTASEIAYMPLGGARLVVLSACETGLGQVAGGEGLLGLQRSFQISGAGATVASLWKVDDRATQAIMTQFYRNYLEEMQPASVALRNAQLWALKNLADEQGQLRGLEYVEDDVTTGDKNPPRLSPKYWAAFSLSGDWR